MSNETRREGIALPTALMAIVLIGALIAGTFFATNQEYRVSRTSLDSERALMAAEYGQNMLLNEWDMNWNLAMKSGDTIKRVYSTGSATVDTVVMTRLRFNMFHVSSTGRTGLDKTSDARRRTNLLIRLDTPEIPFYGAINAAGTANAAGNFSASGNDSVPPGWTDCPPALPQHPVIVVPPAVNVTGQGANCGGGTFNCLTGTPKIANDPAVADSTKVLDNWDLLVAGADKIFDQALWPVIDQVKPFYVGGVCDKAVAKNWGEPIRNSPATDCENYFPTVYLKSAVKGALGPTTDLSQGRGQGILLVDANVRFTGNFTWIGPVIVRGNVYASGMGNKVLGGIHALNQGCTTSPCNNFTGTSSVTYSNCTILKTMNLKSRPAIAKHHGWGELF